jgi:hypothetical protein
VNRIPALVLLAMALGCGKRGDPLPPLARTPQPVRELTVSQRGGELEIRYVTPRQTTGGLRLDVHEVEVLSARGDVDFAKSALVESRKVAPGETVVATQPLPPPGTRLRFAARAVAGGDRSALTPVTTVIVQPAPVPPSDLVARLTPEAVVLTWTGTVPSPPPTPVPSPAASPAPGASPASGASPSPAPAATPTPAASPGAAARVASRGAPSPSPSAPAAAPPAKPATPGFRVFRRDPTTSYAAPMNAVPVTTNAFEDRTMGSGPRWCYVVRAAASVDPVVESVPSNEVCVDIVDVAPPAPPAGVTTVVGADAVDVSWSPSAETDLAGYRVHRAPEGGAPARLAEIPPGQTTWRDPAPGRGALFLYTVTAFDRTGNESAPSKPAEGHLP